MHGWPQQTKNLDPHVWGCLFSHVVNKRRLFLLYVFLRLQTLGGSCTGRRNTETVASCLQHILDDKLVTDIFLGINPPYWPNSGKQFVNKVWREEQSSFSMNTCWLWMNPTRISSVHRSLDFEVSQADSPVCNDWGKQLYLKKKKSPVVLIQLVITHPAMKRALRVTAQEKSQD